MSLRDRLHGLIYTQHVSTGAFDVTIDIDISRFARHLDEAEDWLAHRILDDCTEFIPVASGALRGSGHVVETREGRRIEWDVPYAHYQYEGKVWINPEHNASGFIGSDGNWHGWPGPKVPTERPLMYSADGTGDHWVRTAKDIHMEEWIRGARRVAGGRNV